MASANYAYAYVANGSVGSTLTLNVRLSNTDPIFEDDADPSDGEVAPTGSVMWAGGSYDVLGITTDGDPIIQPPGGGMIRVLSNDGSLSTVGSSASTYVMCFAEGAQIAGPAGEQAVETLSIGDLVTTSDGRHVPVRWIGRQTIRTMFTPAARMMPVRFAAGALGEGRPYAPLTVTADHGMLVDGVICHAGALVNGSTVTRVPLSEMGETFTVYHIETEAHEIILANGAPAETFIDNASRMAFDNYAEFETLYGDVPEMEELPYPRAMSARQVPARIRARLTGRDAA